MINSLKKGFTLVELLIVIAILAVLAAAVVIVLNPAELLAQARDSQRVNDLDTLKSALSIYIAQSSSINLGACGTGGICTFTPAVNGSPFGSVGAQNCASVSTTNTIAGSGWVDVNLSTLPGGSPIPYLPVDPTNNIDYFYGYACSESPNYVFELAGRLESQKSRDKMKTDGGSRNGCASYTGSDCFYEIGTDAGLDL